MQGYNKEEALKVLLEKLKKTDLPPMENDKLLALLDRAIALDFEYMKSMYPDAAKQLLPYIEDECDRVAYEGSVMFDEYPDQLQLHLMGRRVYDRAEKDQVIEKLIRSEGKGADESWIRDLIQVMLYQEIYKRRSDQRKYNQKYYQGIAFPKG